MANKAIKKSDFAFNRDLALSELNAMQEHMGRIEKDKMTLRRELFGSVIQSQPWKLQDIEREPVDMFRTQTLPTAKPGGCRKFISVSQTEIEEMIEEDSDRIQGTLKNLRRDGLCTERNLKALAEKSRELIGPGSLWMIKQEAEVFGERGEEKLKDAYEKQRDEIWLCAIREIIITYHAGEIIAMNSGTYTAFVKNKKLELYAAAIRTTSRLAGIAEIKKESRQKQEWRSKYEARKDELQETKRQSNALRKKIELEVSKKYEASHAALLRDNEFLTKRVAALEKELAKRTQVLPATHEEEFVASAKEENPVEAEPDTPEIEVPPFPEKGVVFIGGHPNMLKKLRQRHQNWSFMTTEDDRKRYTLSEKKAKINVAILWTDHLSHKLYESMMRIIPDGIPIIYASSTNLDAIDEEIRSQWREACIKAMGEAQPA